MNKYLTPYEVRRDCHTFLIKYVRQSLSGNEGYIVAQMENGKWASAGEVGGFFDTGTEAMFHRDSILLEQGYVFLTWEQAEKLTVLL